MDKKKILIISAAFYPLNTPRSFRTTELVKEFSRQGHNVTLLTVLQPGFDYTEFLSEYPITLESIGDLKWKHFERSRYFGDWSRKFGRLLHLFFEYPNIELLFRLKKILPKYKNFDLMISIAVPHPIHWGVASVRSKKNPVASCWVADCGDPFMGNKLDSISPPFYFKYFEDKFLKRADYISVPTEGSIAAYNPKYKNKFRVIPQGFDFRTVKLAAYESNPSKSIFAYAGTVSQIGIRSPHKLVAYLLTKKAFDFEFHIYSNQVNNLQELALQSEGKVILHQGLPREKLLQELSTMDFLVNLENGTSTATPSKLIDYSLTQRPILNISPAAPDENKVDAFLNKDYSKQFILKDVERYNIITVARQFLSLIAK